MAVLVLMKIHGLTQNLKLLILLQLLLQKTGKLLIVHFGLLTYGLLLKVVVVVLMLEMVVGVKANGEAISHIEDMLLLKE